MKNDCITPSESEWIIMEVFWENETPLTSSTVIQKLQGKLDMTPKMVRVLMNRLCQKGILDYTHDEKDARVYQYTALKTREECLKSKSQKFVNSYFSGNKTAALASLIQSIALSDEQISELEEILENSKGKVRK
ncbi:BlaI/MecI/CopY family transcriptional regulator [Lachnospiraceae bacterium 56-18]